MVSYEAGEERVTPDIMACTKGSHGKCTRCGVKHSGERARKAGRSPAFEAKRKAQAWEAKKNAIRHAAQVRIW